MKAFPRMLRGIAALAAFAALAAQAGGPLVVCNNQGVKYPGTGTVSLNYDGGGNLGSRTNTQADAIVTNAVSLWTNVGTSTVVLQRGSDLPVDVTEFNYFPYYGSFSDGLNPVIYDTDGKIIDDVLGPGNSNSVLGFAGSAYNTGTCQYVEGRAVINGKIAIPDTVMTVVIAHEVGHLIGLDHTQLDSAQGLAQANYPLMYPIAFRSSISLHDDDVAAVSALYPAGTLGTVYGQVSGNLRLADGVTAVRGANVWAREESTGKVYSVVSDYLMQGTGFFKLLLPAGTYTLHAEAIHSDFDNGSSVGPYADTYPSSLSFQPPLYPSPNTPMAPVTLGGSTPVQFSIVAGCAATATFRLNGAGSVTGNCGTKSNPSVALASSANPSQRGQSVTFTATVSGGAGTATGSVNFRDGAASITGCSAVALAAGTATCTTSALSFGAHSISAAYSGDSAYNTATSSTLGQSVQLATASSALASSANPSLNAQFVTFTATISGAVGTPTGTVNFRNGSISLAGCSAVALAGGVATCATNGLANGNHSITAVYSGDSFYGTATSTALIQAVQANSPGITPLIGISTRMQVLTGENVLIGGFIVGGSASKTVVVRARGPSLASQGVAGALADPTLTLVPAAGPAVSNNDWGTAANAAALQASGFAPANAKESAIMAALAPGAYTAIVSGAGNTTGVAIVEIYEIDHPEIPMTGISTRGRVQTGENVMIGGFIIGGSVPRRVVVRARGPSLASQGVAGVLSNPVLTLVPASGPAIANDDWGTAANASTIQAIGFAPADARESAILVTLDPGAYTAIVSGAGGTSGVAIVEVFAAP